jgi:hypothetical protein
MFFMKLKISKRWFKSRIDLEEGEIGAGNPNCFKDQRKLSRSRCGRTGKVGYKSHDAAMLAACDVMAKPNCHARQFSAYRCTYCGLWHLTSKET